MLTIASRRVALAATTRNQFASRASGARFVSTLKEYKVRTNQMLDDHDTSSRGHPGSSYDDIMEYRANGTTVL
jgi:hypothetical protein